MYYIMNPSFLNSGGDVVVKIAVMVKMMVQEVMVMVGVYIAGDGATYGDFRDGSVGRDGGGGGAVEEG